MDVINNTIVALSTPVGYGALAVIRLSGPESLRIINRLIDTKNPLIPNRVKYFNLYENQTHIDDVLITYFKSPHSYTGEDIIEISCHGSPYIVETIIQLCLNEGAHLAEPGEFTKRAFLNDKMDLSQAEGVNALIHAKTKSAHDTAKKLLEGQVGNTIKELQKELIDTITLLELELDFSDQEIDFTPREKIIYKIQTLHLSISQLIDTYYYGKMISDGIKTVLIGSPNSGKSSLMNAFLQEERVIVSDIPGTTRDSIEESFRRGGYQFRITDTAGLRKTTDKIENLGIDRSLKIIKEADIKLIILDPTQETVDLTLMEQFKSESTIFVINKIDIASQHSIDRLKKAYADFPIMEISAKQYINIHQLADKMVNIIKNQEPRDSDIFITIQRHLESLQNASQELSNTLQGIADGNTSELIVTDLRFALNYLDQILGKTSDDDILNHIFKNFCIGK